MSEAAAIKRAPDNLGKSMTPGKFAMWSFLCSDAMGFACLFAAYFATRASGLTDHLAPWAETWWPDATVVLDVDLTAINTFILICSSVTMVWALSACQRGDRGKTLAWLAATIICGSIFLSIQVVEYTHLAHYGALPWTNGFWGTFYGLTCYHGMHVTAGVIYLICMFIGTLRGKYGKDNSTPLEILGLFWHFVDLVWIVLFTFIYLLQPLN